jgi:hypothetical protein
LGCFRPAVAPSRSAIRRERKVANYGPLTRTSSRAVFKQKRPEPQEAYRLPFILGLIPAYSIT